jgi:hypothetical protein
MLRLAVHSFHSGQYMADSQSPARVSVAKVVLASFIGTAIEWYDFFLYGTAAALVFGKLFFPTLDPFAGVWRPSPPMPWGSSPGQSAASSLATSATASGANPPWWSR